MSKIKVSDYIVEFLLRRGINMCFTVTGGGAMHLNDSFGHNKEITCVYNHHEQACAMGAEGYTRLSRIPAVVCVTSGPGATNAITGVVGAWLDSIPMIVLSGQMNSDTLISSTPVPLRQLGFQEFNIIESVKNMTKYAEMVTDPKYIAYHLEKALFLAENGRKGPVWLDIPLDVQSAKVEESELVHFVSPTTNRKPTLLDVAKVIDKINAAKKPVILAGYGIRMSDAYGAFMRSLIKLRIPVVTEWNSNDLIPNDLEFFAGRAGTIGDRGGNFVVQNADLLLCLGCQLSIRQLSYKWNNFAKNAYKIAINSDENELVKPIVKIDMPIHADVKEFLMAINELKEPSCHSIYSNWNTWTRQINEKYPVVLKKHIDSESPISIYAVMQSLSSCLRSGDVVVLANGAACVVGLQAIKVKARQRIFTNAGASSMGYGIAAAVGAAYSSNGVPVICIEGDGSIQMNIQELQTIVHNKLNVKIIWINNSGYHSIKQTQLAMFNAEKKGYCGADTTSGISFPSAEKIATAYGIKFFRINNSKDLDVTLKTFYEEDGPSICEVVTIPDEKFEPKLQSKLLEDGTFMTPSLEDMYPFLSKEEMAENAYNDA